MSSQTESFTTKLQTASQVWQNFSLESKRQALQQSATQTKTNNQQSQKTRKALAETTKSFKKAVKQTESAITKNSSSSTTSSGSGSNSNSNSEGSNKVIFEKFSTQCKSIVKSYQEEIDSLTKRCKASDASFLDLYKSLIDIQDPAPLLQNAVDHLNSMEGQVHHLLKGMEEMQHEMEKQEMKTQSHQDEIEKLKKELELSQKENSSSNKSQDQSNSQNSYLSKEEKEELISLRTEVTEYEVEFKTLKNQDITIKKLNAKIEDLIENQEAVVHREVK